MWACSEGAPDSSAAPVLKTLVIGQGRVGPLSIGMDYTDATGTGMVEQVDSGECRDRVDSTYPMETMYFEYCRASDDDLDGILIKVPGPHTTEGIEVGSSRSEVKEVYGDRLVSARAQFAGGTLVLEDERGDIRFNFDQGSVFTIDVTRHRTPTFDGSG